MKYKKRKIDAEKKKSTQNKEHEKSWGKLISKKRRNPRFLAQTRISFSFSVLFFESSDPQKVIENQNRVALICTYVQATILGIRRPAKRKIVQLRLCAGKKREKDKRSESQIRREGEPEESPILWWIVLLWYLLDLHPSFWPSSMLHKSSKMGTAIYIVLHV